MANPSTSGIGASVYVTAIATTCHTATAMALGVRVTEKTGGRIT